MRKLNLLLTLVALSLATSSLWAKPTVADENGKLPGAFSVACGEYVYFSQGNLQFRATADGSGTDLTHEVTGGSTAQGVWRFAEEQYYYVGDATNGNVYVGEVKCNNAQISQTYTGWIDLFGWGTSGWDNNGSSARIAYQPWATSSNNGDYGVALPRSSSETLTGDNANADWGVNNAISNGGNQAGLWRTLTSQEWQYLLTQRTNATTLRTFATVNGVLGFIIMPDGWTANDVSLTITTDYTTNVINLTNWRKLEEQGCVFLPAAGEHYGTSIYNMQNIGLYWSSSAKDESYAYLLYARTENVYYINKLDTRGRFRGLSVRLVQDVPENVELSLMKAYVSADPVGKTNMTYTGSSQTLLSSLAGTATGGTVKYKLSTSGSWSTSNPSATNAGDYTVEWFVDHTGRSDCYVSSDIKTINVTIKRKSAGVAAPSPMPTIEATSFAYNGSAQNLVTATGSIQSGYTTVYSTDGVNWSEDIPQGTDAGDYTVYYKFYKGTNEEYIPSPNTINATIAKGDIPGVTLPEATSTIPYDGTEKTLVEIDPVPANCTVSYSTDGGNTWTTTPPTATDANDYSVQYKIVPDDPNYNTIGPNTVTVTILDYPTVYDNADPTTKLTELLNTPSDLKVKRTIYADDEYNTICIPFALDESALAASPLAGFNRLKTFKGAQVTGTAPDLYIDIFVEDATTIEAGVPYLITYPSAHADIVDPVFTGITVTTTEPSAVSVDGITFQGMFAQVHIDPYDAGHTQDYLFVGANSQLYWPLSTQTSSDIKMRGFRAYFIIDRNSISPALAPKGTRARIMDAPKTTTDIDNTSAKFGGSEKIMENGILYIIRNGVKYNAQGQVIK